MRYNGLLRVPHTGVMNVPGAIQSHDEVRSTSMRFPRLISAANTLHGSEVFDSVHVVRCHLRCAIRSVLYV